MKRFEGLLVIALLFILSNAKAQPKYEFRGVWIASVDNIDWPKRGMYETEAQKADFIRQLDLHKKNGMNAVIVQIRPAADAFYPSQYEPWSQWLTGVQGQPPSPYYDPLEFMVSETHKRGMEFHAWCNPYRANFNVNNASIAANHVTRIHPEWFLTYGDKKYFDPANKLAQQFVVTVIRDIVKRYAIDAIHMDDYFYPYRIAGKEFPDEASYRNSGSRLNKEDWRRSNVDSIIRQLSVAIKQEKSAVRFGISPFSVWRNKDKDPQGSDSQAGQTNYDDLYADILLWLKKGWIDYVAPQLYLEIGHPKIAYEKLLEWWSRHGYGKHIYIGHGIYRTQEKAPGGWNNPNELPAQINLLRRYPTIQGSIYYTSHNFDKNPHGWNDSLRNNYYRYPALIPPMRWIDNEKPWPPIVDKSITRDSVLELSIRPDPRNRIDVKYYIVYKYATESHTELFGNAPWFIHKFIMEPGGTKLTDTLSSGRFSYRYVVTAVGKNNNESDLSEIAILVQPDNKWRFY